MGLFKGSPTVFDHGGCGPHEDGDSNTVMIMDVDLDDSGIATDVEGKFSELSFIEEEADVNDTETEEEEVEDDKENAVSHLLLTPTAGSATSSSLPRFPCRSLISQRVVDGGRSRENKFLTPLCNTEHGHGISKGKGHSLMKNNSSLYGVTNRSRTQILVELRQYSEQRRNNIKKVSSLKGNDMLNELNKEGGLLKGTPKTAFSNARRCAWVPKSLFQD